MPITSDNIINIYSIISWKKTHDFGWNIHNCNVLYIWLVVLTILKNISQWKGLSHILWKIKQMFETTNQYI